MLLTLDQVVSVVAFGVLVVLFVRSLRATREINRIYQHDLEEPKSTIIRQFRDGSAVKVIAAAWFTAVTLRALADVPLPEEVLFLLRIISLSVAVVVLDLPSRYLKTVRRIQDGDNR